ncbi:MAG: pentatricopeptide repeat-containing protein [Betaproteobacteria bacterium]|nr:pentatricopeptide repeat-containing protein [Betaproteobacteria bacterium]
MGIALGNAFGWLSDVAGRLFGSKAAARSREISGGQTPEPALLDFFNDNKQPGLFHDFHFSGRATRYVMDKSLWRDFETFYRAPQALSCWLITGSAGAGKSRAALEFCRALETGQADFRFADEAAGSAGAEPVIDKDFSAWKTGFLNLAGTPFSTWKDWEPKQNTLLVFDRATRHYNDGSRLCTGWADGEDARHRFNVGEIIKLLAAKAEQGCFGPFRVRLLLLEREHRQVSRNWYMDVVNPALRFREESTPLPPMTPEGLFGIAQDIWKHIGQDDAAAPCAASDAFLEKLCSVDSERRPLFAMLLAAAMTTDGGAESAFTRRDVLKLALQGGYERVLRLAGEEGAMQAMRILALSTLTGGRLGACDLDKDDALWDSGLGHAASGEEGIFYPWPVEPELLGECFILGDMGQDGVPEDVRIGDDEMRTLIVKAWETCSPEVAYFFECCGQDFSSDPAWIETHFLNCHLADVDTPLYMQTAVNLVTWFGKGQLDAARKIYDHMNGVGNAGMFCRERAEVSTNLIRIYCGAGMFDEASPVFLTMNTLGGSKEVQRCRAAASVYLVEGLCKAKELVRARVMFEGALAFEETEEFLLPRALALISLINGYSRAGDFAEARELFGNLAVYGDSEKIRVLRAKASVNMIVCHCKAGHLEEAHTIYEGMRSLGDEAKVRKEYVKASKFLEYFTATKQPGIEEKEMKPKKSVAASA